METLAHRSEISDTFSNVRIFSFQEKKSPFLDEESTNVLLDAILDLKNSLKEKTTKIYFVNERIEKLTWFDDLDEESLMLINDTISSAKDLNSSLIRQYISINNIFRKK